MRVRLLFFLAAAFATAACDTETAPVRLDFVGATGLTSSNRGVNAADTLTSRAYAEGEESLTHLRVTVKYEPTPDPILYPVPLSTYDPANVQKEYTLVYLDSTLTSGAKSLLFQNRFGARTTSGTERWEYSATDARNRTASRAYRLNVRRGDSTDVFHTYTTTARPGEAGAASRRFLALRQGLLLPKYSVNNPVLADNQKLIDLVFVSQASGVSLRVPRHSSLGLSAVRWPEANRRGTRLRRTGLSYATFLEANTADEFRAAFVGGTRDADSLSTGPLAKDNVLAFQTIEPGGARYYGLLYVGTLTLGSAPLINCAIRIQK